MRELQGEFLNEVTFLLESYEESMLLLENGTDPAGQLVQIFRVAHSIKGGAAAVGFPDLSKFAHLVEDLLCILRSSPELVNSDIISVLLKSGDEFSKRVEQLKGDKAPLWDTTELQSQLKLNIEKLSGPTVVLAAQMQKAEAVIPFDEPASSVPTEDVTNYELLNELLAELPAEEVVKIKVEEERKKPQVSATPEAPTSAAVKVAASSEGTKSTGVKQSSSQSIKVDTSRVDSVLDAMGELVVLKNQIIHDESVKSGAHPNLAEIVDQLDKAVRELYDKTLSIRMTPLKSLFLKIQRIVRDVSISLDKPIELKLIGEETEVERTVFELLNDPLVHMVRNAVDHGIENRETRKQRGKPVVSTLVVSAKQSGGTVLIEIIDDGGGINRDKVLAKAIEKNIISKDRDPSTIPDEEVFKLIFAPGFSTAEKISDLSGRGVGLDVVRANIEKVNGKINISSKMGLGSNFKLTIPLTTAITDGIIVAMEGSRYIIPIHSIRELVRLQKKDFTVLNGGSRVAKIRESLIPVVDLSLNLHQFSSKYVPVTSERKREGESMLVVIDVGSRVMALPVDQVIGQTQVVVKPLATGTHVHEVAGAAILGDGKTVLILDPTAIGHEIQKEAVS